MQSSHDMPLHPYIEVKEGHPQNLILGKVLQALYPQESIHWTSDPHVKEIDTYVLFYLCPYGVEEAPLLKEGMRYAQEVLKNPQFKSAAHVLIIFYRDLKVDFPERKLQREKVMSEMITEEILAHEASIYRDRIWVTHEFGVNHLQDTLQQLTGSHLYFEIMN